MSPTPPPAATIGKYQILHLVGEGAMGAVYRALDPVLQRPVAIKVMSDAVSREQELRERFLREAQAAGSLQHPNVVTIYDFGEVEGHLYIAMEFLDGEDLEALLARGDELPLPAKLGIAVDVLGGLSYAHKRGIVHRDIKPANIRVTEDARAKIMDFGVAHLTSQKMTRTGITMGTPNYMAPEQVTAGAIGPHTDVFSLGAVLYELVTRHKPFAADTLHAVLYKIVSEPTPPPSTYAPGLPPALDAIVARALTKDPVARYQTAAEMANDLTELRALLTTGPRPSASISLNARLAEIPAAPTSTPAPVPVPVPVPAPAPAPAPPPAASATKGAGRGALLATGAVAAAAVAAAVWVLGGRSGASPAPSASPAAAAPVAGSPEAPAAGAAPEVAPIVAPPVPASPAVSTPAPAAAATAERPPAVARPAASRATGEPPRVAAGAAPAGSSTARVPEPTPTLTVPRPPAVTTTTRSEAPAPAPAREVAPPVVEARPAPAPAANAAAEIADAVARYARAISARDLGAVRAAYPSISGAQAQNFERFFATVRELQATFSLGNLDVSGATAEGRLTGVYEFVTGGGQRQRSPVSFQASFRRAGDGWVLSSVR
jgi:serine/threonine-protein kinase